MSQKHDRETRKAELLSGISIEVVKADGVKCPRCWKFTIEGESNFDNLCNVCIDVILDCYPDHPSVPFIMASHIYQYIDGTWVKTATEA